MERWERTVSAQWPRVGLPHQLAAVLKRGGAESREAERGREFTGRAQYTRSADSAVKEEWKESKE